VTRFRDLSIRHKLPLMTLVSTGAALILASGGFLAWDLVQFRSGVRQDMRAQAAIIAENSGAPLTFRDERVGADILAGLRERPHMEVACLYTSDGAVFASYRRPERRAECPDAPAGTRYGWDAFEVSVPVTVNAEPVGTFYIRRSLRDMYARLRVGAATVLGLLLLAIGAAFLTGARMQKSIVTPLLQLASTARAISETRDYSLRAVPGPNDEVGIVVRACNEMLDRIAEALERERAANRLKDEFLATLSHELRTPLNSILGWSRMLRSSRLDPAWHEKALETIERNARAQALLIEDLLDMSRIASGKPRLQVREADLAAILDAAIAVVQPGAAAKRLRIHVEIGVRPALTRGDPGRLQQVVWNLLSNAVKFTPAEGQIWVRLEREQGYRLSVRDSGVGMDPAFLTFVFQPFRQADGTTTREHGGLGLGLAIAKQLVELHGGTIQAQSDGLGKGATFEVYLPSVVESPAESPGPPNPPEVLPPMRVDPSLLRGLHVLVVDDEEDARVLLETTLTQHGATVVAVASVADALAAVDERLPDVLLSDVGMPTEDGMDLIRRLRARPRSRGGGVPAVAITAYASVADGLAAEAAGYQSHLAKPFDPAEVASLVAFLAHSTGSPPQAIVP